jgi:ribosome biogenesis GTPase
LALKVHQVSEATHKGRHTTSGTRVVPLAGGSGYVADTAGIRAMALGSIAAGKLDWCFREFRPYLGRCRLGDCTHVHEPGCGVRRAAEDGALDRERYASYCRLVAEGAATAGRAWRDLVSTRSVVGEGEFRL